MQHKPRGPGDKGAFTRFLFPCEVMYAVGTQSLHQQVPRRVKADVIQPLPGGVIAQ